MVASHYEKYRNKIFHTEITRLLVVQKSSRFRIVAALFPAHFDLSLGLTFHSSTPHLMPMGDEISERIMRLPELTDELVEELVGDDTSWDAEPLPVLTKDEMARGIVENLHNANQRQFVLGDLVVAYIEAGGTVSELIAEYQLNPEDSRRLHEFKATAKAFPADRWDRELPYTRYDLARYEARKFDITPGEALRHIEEPLPEILAGLSRRRGKTLASISQRRDASWYFAVLDRAAKARATEPAKPSPDILAKCHYGDCCDFAGTLDDGSVKLCWMDPPYPNPRHASYGRASAGAVLVGFHRADNAAFQPAMATIVAAIRAYAPKLRRDGVLLLCQGHNPIHPEILAAVEASGMEMRWMLIWRKPVVASNFREPYTNDKEIIGVICHAGAELESHDNAGDRRTILEFEPVRKENLTTHDWQKPDALNQYFVNRHTHQGELVVDAFGCSGSMAIAAAKLGRDWRYCESDHENFNFGVGRITAALSSEGTDQLSAGQPADFKRA